MNLDDKQLKLTPKRIEAMHSLGIYDTEALLRYYPYRYDQLNASPFDTWKVKEKVTFEGTVISEVKLWRHGHLSSARFDVSCRDHVIHVTIFNRPWIRNQLSIEHPVTITGTYNGDGKVTAVTYDTKPLSEHNAVTPVYSTRSGVTQYTVHAVLQHVYEAVKNDIIDDIPEEYAHKYRLLRKSESYRRIHFPENMKDVEAAERTLKYDEFLRFFTAVYLRRNSKENSLSKQPRHIDMRKLQSAISSLPYTLTEGQSNALHDILMDMKSTHPMYRLIQGDVGCGKTAVAALSLYACVLSGYQGALLAPTEILARQHLATLRSMLKDTDLTIEALYSGLPQIEKERILKDTESGKVDILIGTHSILQKQVCFHNLGFVAADEQQRFGVDQRRILKEKGEQVDFLLMSATPIPRTLASTIFGDMNTSTIDTLPEGRKDPETILIRENSFRSVLSDVKELLQEGRQLYVICAAVEENEDYKARDVSKTAAVLSKLFTPYRVGVLHGQMKSEEKDSVMNEFYKNQIQVLVSTTVVEVGMNVVNATGMIVYDADRFGLSQLHQLRGRIQRGSVKGHCWLLTGSRDEHVLERLNVLVNSNDGFEISREDLRLRGPGDILGTRQSGVPYFILGNLITDTKIIDTAKKDAEYAVRNRNNPAYTVLVNSVIEEKKKHAAVQ